MVNTGKLIKQIREALHAGGENFPIESLASEYATLCHEANQRLETCAAMLSKGSEYQALQLAEAEPVLLDLIAQLSFAEAPEWSEFCKEQKLSVPVKFDAKEVQALDDLYARGVSANHPLYKDYRAAVSARDDAKAIQVIRSIVRLNPNDANARAELTRLENKLFQQKLQSLKEALGSKQEERILAEYRDLERLALPAKLAEIPEAALAAEIRRRVESREAAELSARLITVLPAEMQSGSWRTVGDLLARVDGLRRDHGFSLDLRQEETFAKAHKEWSAWRYATEQTARFNEALSALGAMAGELETRLLTRSTLTLPEAEARYAEFGRKWRAAEQFQREIPSDLGAKVHQNAAMLRTELERMQKQKRAKLIAAVAVAVIVLGVAGWMGTQAIQAGDYARNLAELRVSGQVEAAEKMSSMLRKEKEGLTAQSSLRTKLEEIDAWARQERAKLAVAEEKIGGLEGAAKNGFSGADPFAVSADLQNVVQLIGDLAPGLRGGPETRITVVRNSFEVWAGSIKDRIAKDAEAKLSAIEASASANLGYDQPTEVIVATLNEIEPVMKDLRAAATPSVEELQLPPALVSRVNTIGRRVDQFRAEVDGVQRVNESLLEATSLGAYQKALTGFKDSRLAQSEAVVGARKILASFPKEDEVLAGLLLPDDPAAWVAAKGDKEIESFIPSTVTPAELTKLVAISDDENLSNIYVGRIIADLKGRPRQIFSRGEMRAQSGGYLNGTSVTSVSGNIYDPATHATVTTFTKVPLRVEQKAAGYTTSPAVKDIQKSNESAALARLELQRMTDGGGTRFEKPIIRVFEELVRQKDINPLFKAFIMRRLNELLQRRPYSWGLQYCASLRRDLAELERLTAEMNLNSSDWMLPSKNAEFGPILAPFFAGLQSRSYMTEARMHRDTLRAVLRAGVQYGGFIDAENRARTIGDGVGAKELWAMQAETGGFARYSPGESSEQMAKWMRFSPLIFVPVDRKALLVELDSKGTKSDGLPMPVIPFLQQ